MWVYKGVTLDRYIWPHRYVETFASVSELWDWLITDTWKIYSEKEIKKRWTIINITPIPNPPKLLPVGTKVRVFEENSKALASEGVFEIAIEPPLTISMYSLRRSDWSIIHGVPARAVVPVLE